MKIWSPTRPSALNGCRGLVTTGAAAAGVGLIQPGGQHHAAMLAIRDRFAGWLSRSIARHASTVAA